VFVTAAEPGTEREPALAPTKSGVHFIEFLDVLLADYPDQSILLVTDNGSSITQRRCSIP